MWNNLLLKVKVWLGLAKAAQDVIDDVQEKVKIYATKGVDDIQDTLDDKLEELEDKAAELAEIAREKQARLAEIADDAVSNILDKLK